MMTQSSYHNKSDDYDDCQPNFYRISDLISVYIKKSLGEQPISVIKEFIASKTYLEYLANVTYEI